MAHQTPSLARRKRLAALSDGLFDVFVIGGGIHGAAAARDAALRGLRVALVERADYAEGTSSRSSKLLHGGVRYLEQGNLRLLYEGLHERETLRALAPHITRTVEFAFPVTSASPRPPWQISAGLQLYDLLARIPGGRGRRRADRRSYRRYKETDHETVALRAAGLSFDSLFGYRDAQVEDTRLVIEHIIDAEALGATLLNHVEVESGIRDTDGGWVLTLRERLSGEVITCRAAYVVSCAGPWMEATADRMGVPRATWPPVVLSQGSHLLFRRPWPHPALILPAEAYGRVYFVLPYFQPGVSATLVGTTDVPVSAAVDDPRTMREEREMLLTLLRRDLPGAGLDESELYASFAGLRVLAGSKNARTSTLSRSETFLESERAVTFVGGKYTTARLTAERMVDRAMVALGRSVKQPSETAWRPLPGAPARPVPALTGGGWSEARLRALFGARADSALGFVDGDDTSGEHYFRAAVRFVVATEHAATVADVRSRRVLTDRDPGARPTEEIEIIRQVLGEAGYHEQEERS